MQQRVISTSDGHRVEGCGPDGELVNGFLSHLVARAFSPATVRAYAYDLLNFLRFLTERGAGLRDVVATDLFDYLDWQQRSRAGAGKVVRLTAASGRRAGHDEPRIAAVRGLFEFAVTTGARTDNPVPAARRSSGLRARPRGLLGHVGAGRPRAGGRLVRQPRRLPEALEAARRRGVPGRSAHQPRPGDHPADAAGWAARRGGPLAAAGGRGHGPASCPGHGQGRQGTQSCPSTACSSPNWPPTCARNAHRGAPAPSASWCCAGRPSANRLTEAGLRRIFRTHRHSSGALRVRPHRLRHTYGTELAAAGIDLLVLRELMGHAHPETTAAYVHLAPETLAAEYARARAGQR